MTESTLPPSASPGSAPVRPASLLTPGEAALVLVDPQAGLAFGVGSQDRETLRSHLVAVARTAAAFAVPVVVTTSASKVYSGPVMPPVAAALPGVAALERRNMNAWEDDAVRAAILATGRRRLVFAGLLTESCVSFPALDALAAGFDVRVVGDACGGITAASHELGLRRLEAAGATLTSWLQLLLEFQRDWSRKDTYEAARSVVVDHGGGYGIGLDYARAMIHPA